MDEVAVGREGDDVRVGGDLGRQLDRERVRGVVVVEDSQEGDDSAALVVVETEVVSVAFWGVVDPVDRGEVGAGDQFDRRDRGRFVQWRAERDGEEDGTGRVETGNERWGGEGDRRRHVATTMRGVAARRGDSGRIVTEGNRRICHDELLERENAGERVYVDGDVELGGGSWLEVGGWRLVDVDINTAG